MTSPNPSVIVHRHPAHRIEIAVGLDRVHHLAPDTASWSDSERMGAASVIADLVVLRRAGFDVTGDSAGDEDEIAFLARTEAGGVPGTAQVLHALSVTYGRPDLARAAVVVDPGQAIWDAPRFVDHFDIAVGW